MDKSVILGFKAREVEPGKTCKVEARSPGFFAPTQIFFADSCRDLMVESLTYEFLARLPPDRNEGQKVTAQILGSGPVSAEVLKGVPLDIGWLNEGNVIEIEVSNPTSRPIVLRSVIAGRQDIEATIFERRAAESENRTSPAH